MDCGSDVTLESTELSKGPVASAFLLGLHVVCIAFRNAIVLRKLLFKWQRSDFCKIFFFNYKLRFVDVGHCKLLRKCEEESLLHFQWKCVVSVDVTRTVSEVIQLLLFFLCSFLLVFTQHNVLAIVLNLRVSVCGRYVASGVLKACYKSFVLCLLGFYLACLSSHFCKDFHVSLPLYVTRKGHTCLVFELSWDFYLHSSGNPDLLLFCFSCVFQLSLNVNMAAV